MTLQQIKSFLAVVKCGSFNKAEESTFLTKQALKKHVDSLEAEFGFQLLNRNSKGVSLTRAGEKFYEASLKGVDQLNLLLQDCRRISMEHGCLRIGNPPHPRLLLENAFNVFAERYPDIRLDVVITKHQLSQKILDNELDIAEFVYRPNLLVKGVSYKKICDLKYRCVMLPTHPLASHKEIRPEELADYIVGITELANIEFFNYFKEAYPDIAIRDMPVQDTPNIMNICYNHGVVITKAYFPDMMAPLVTVPLQCPIETECGVIYRTNSVSPNFISPVSAFLDVLDELYPQKNEESE